MLTTVVNLLALAVSLWLGFYILTRSPRSSSSWLAALMLWSLDTYLLSNVILNNLPSNIWVAWLQQGAILVLPLLLHLTVLLLPEPLRARRQMPLIRLDRWAVPLAYVIAAVLIAFGVLPSDPPVGLVHLPEFESPATVPLRFLSGAAGPLYPCFLGFLILTGALALVNLWQARELTRHRTLSQPFTIFFIAAALATIGALYSVIGTWLNLHPPSFPADILYGVGIGLVGYAVARYAALIEGRPIERDFIYTILAVGSLTGFYVLVACILYLGGQVTFLALVLTIVGTIVANSLFDGVRIALDRIFYQTQFQTLRGNLRALAREAGTGATLNERLQAILDALCRALRVQKGFIARRREEQWMVEATHEANPVGQTFGASTLAGNESVGLLHVAKKGLPGMTLLIPLFAGGRQIGALVLGPKETKQPYADADLDLLEDLGDQIASVIHRAGLQEENAQTLNALVQDFREKERALQLQMQELLAAQEMEPPRAPEAVSEETLLPQVEDALRRLHDFSYLGELPLAKLRVVERCLRTRGEATATFIERGKALSEVLTRTLDELRPDAAEPGKNEIPPREWHPFIILHDSYVLDEPNRNIMSRLYISEGTFNRTRRRALKSVAKSLAEMEQQAANIFS